MAFGCCGGPPEAAELAAPKNVSVAEEAVPPEQPPSPDQVAAEAAAKVKAEADEAAKAAAARVAKEVAEAKEAARVEEQEHARLAALEAPKVIDEHLARAKKFFDKLDRDNDGKVDASETVKLAEWVFTGFHEAGEPMDAAAQAAEIEKLKALDANKDGVLDFDEFGEWWNTTAAAFQAHQKAAARVKREAERARAAEEKAAAAAKAAEEAAAAAAEAAAAAAEKAQAEAEAAAAVAAKWWEAELSGTVTRKDIRSLPRAEQERYANAIDKMMQSVGGVPGSSQYFRLASYHGGPKTDMWNKAGEYCVHGQEAFPGWHRAYLLEFEQVMRKADMALGGDGE